MKLVVQKSKNSVKGWAKKLTALAVGVACFASVMSPATVSAQGTEATQLKYLQLLVVLTGEAPWFPAGATSRDYVQWARNNNMRPTGGWNADAPVTSDIIAQTLSQLLGYSPRKYNGDYYRTLSREGIYLQKQDVITSEWLARFISDPWAWSKQNPPSPKDPKDPKDPKNPGPKDDKGKGRGHNRR
jgi:hypothetical protein